MPRVLRRRVASHKVAPTGNIDVVVCIVRSIAEQQPANLIKWDADEQRASYRFQYNVGYNLGSWVGGRHKIAVKHSQRHQAEFRIWLGLLDCFEEAIQLAMHFWREVRRPIKMQSAQQDWAFNRLSHAPLRKLGALSDRLAETGGLSGTEAYFLFCFLCTVKALAGIQPYDWTNRCRYIEPDEPTDRHYVLRELANITHYASLFPRHFRNFLIELPKGLRVHILERRDNVVVARRRSFEIKTRGKTRRVAVEKRDSVLSNSSELNAQQEPGSSSSRREHADMNTSEEEDGEDDRFDSEASDSEEKSDDQSEGGSGAEGGEETQDSADRDLEGGAENGNDESSENGRNEEQGAIADRPEDSSDVFSLSSSSSDDEDSWSQHSSDTEEDHLLGDHLWQRRWGELVDEAGDAVAAVDELVRHDRPWADAVDRYFPMIF